MAPARAFEKLMNGTAQSTEELTKNAKEAVELFSSIPEPLVKLPKQQTD